MFNKHPTPSSREAHDARRLSDQVSALSVSHLRIEHDWNRPTAYAWPPARTQALTRAPSYAIAAEFYIVRRRS